MDFMLPESNWRPPASLPSLSGATVVALDTENRDDGLANDRGPGWVYRAGWVAGVSYAADTGESGYIPIRHPDTECFNQTEVGVWLRRILRTKRCVFHRAVYDIG